MIIDKDLLSIQEARDLARKAYEAQQEYKHFTQQQVDKIVKAMADAGYEASERLAKMACDESGFGNWQDKVIKNQFSTKNVYESIKNLRTVGIVGEEADGKVLKIWDDTHIIELGKTYETCFQAEKNKDQLILQSNKKKLMIILENHDDIFKKMLDASSSL